MAVAIMVQDFLLYGEDPISDSFVDVNMSGVGEIWNLLTEWPSDAKLIAIRLSLIFGCLCICTYICRQWIHHRLLRDCLKLTMFHGDTGNDGTLFVSSFGAIGALYGAALAYNAVVPEGTKLLTTVPGFDVQTYSKGTQCWSVFLDIVGILMIIDTVLQDRRTYPNWGSCIKKLWNDACCGWVRVLAVWGGILGMVACTTRGILMTGYGKGAIQWKESSILGGWTENGRAIFLCWVIFCDLMTIAQDWEFPTFQQPLDSDTYVAGTFQRNVKCTCCAGLGRFFHVTISGKWFTFGPLMFVMAADLLCLKNQVMYEPSVYGQYVDPTTKQIWTVVDRSELLKIYEDGILKRPDLITWEARRTSTGEPKTDGAATDVANHAHFVGSTWLKYLCVLPSVLLLVGFFGLIWGGERVWRDHRMEDLGHIGEKMHHLVVFGNTHDDGSTTSLKTGAP